MISLLEDWANINSGSENLEGLKLMLAALKQGFSGLGAEMQSIALPPRKKIDRRGEFFEVPAGEALLLKKHPEASRQILLAGHYDTVYPLTSPFQKVERMGADKLCGPGVADMKGGLVVMLKALEILEASDQAGKVGWEVILNPDEEVGSPSSQFLFKERARGKLMGLIFEPSFPDGSLVGSRKGSMTFTLIARGKSAHAGRDFYRGKNAITALARAIVKADLLNHNEKGITLNFGHIEGGGPTNIVPDLAICRINARMVEFHDMKAIRDYLENLTYEMSQEGLLLTLIENSARVPKPFEEKSQHLFEILQRCGSELGLSLTHRPSGGVCDGNLLAEAGLPTLDTLGVVGGEIHTLGEYVLLSSLQERSTLVGNFLTHLTQRRGR